MKKISATLILSLLLLCSATFVARAQSYNGIVYVTPTGAGTHSGDSWENATSDIDEAQWIAQVNNAVVWVASGTYYGDTTATSENAFTMVEGVNVYGGFAGNEPEDYDLSLRDFAANATILDGQNARRVLYQPSVFNVQTTWSGFTIQNGETLIDGGAGVSLWNGMLNHCVIKNNLSADNGGGVAAFVNSTLSNCIITKNTTAYGSGGGVFAGENILLSNCLISNNTAATGGGVYSVNATIRNSTVVRNSANNGVGSGVYGGGSLMNSIVWGNGASIMDIDNISGNITCDYSAIEGGYEGDSILFLYDENPPFFVNPSFTTGAGDTTADVDWHLLPNSPCINRGNNAFVVDSFDLGGTARIKRDTVDLGCYESKYYNGTICFDEEKCPLQISLTSSYQYNTYPVEVLVDGLPYTTLYYYSSSGSLDTTLLFCPEQSVELFTNQNVYGLSSTVTDPFGNVTENNSGLYYFNRNVCAPKCSLVVEIGMSGSLENAVLPWIEVYEGDDTIPSYICDLNTEGGAATIPVTSGIPAHFVWQDPDALSNNCWFTIYSPDAEVLLEKHQNDWMGTGIFLNYTSHCDNFGSGSVVYVTPTGTGSGSSWNDALSSIKAANIIALNKKADVWVAAGTYYGDTSSSSESAFSMLEGVNVYGGFAGNEPADFDLSQRNIGTNKTILDGQNTRRVLNSHYFTKATLWDGFTIQHGRSSYGGGVFLQANAQITRCSIVDNYSTGGGGGVYAVHGSVSNCLIANNTANWGGGMVASYASVVNSTIVHNSGNSGMSCEQATLANSIVWGNETAVGTPSNISGTVTCTYSAIEGGHEGESIITLNDENPPLFVNPSLTVGANDSTDNVDWHLQQGSPCINQGDNTAVTDVWDLDGKPRIKQDVVDLGCYESEYEILPEYDSIIYVTETGAGTHSGDSWANATSSIEEAQTIAQANNAVVWVAAGTYYGDTTAVNAFTMHDGVNVYGGFAGNEPADYDLSLRDFEANETVLDGQNARRVLLQPMEFERTTEWNGFTMRHGRVTTMGGAGAYLQTNGKLSDCVVENNQAIGAGGGGIYGVNSVIHSCTVKNNSSNGNGSSVNNGGGICASNSSITDCRISYNTLYNPHWQNIGGGIYLTDHNSVLKNCIVTHNTSSGDGGGAFVARVDSVKNCIVTHNTSSMYGGGLVVNVEYTPATVSNCIIANNFANLGGNGICTWCYYANVNIANSTIVRNSGNALLSSSNGRTNVYNSIFWGNGSNFSGDVRSSYSAISGGSGGNDNIVLDNTNQQIRFMNPSLTLGPSDATDIVDWHLQEGSVCINHGDNSAVTDSFDLDGNPRIKYDTVDMGCYEFDYDYVPIVEYDSIIYVTVTGAGNHSGNSWANAISSIDSAQTLAEEHNAVVWVASGTYYGDTTAVNAFTMHDGVNVYGGFAGNEPADYDLSLRDFEANETVLDGQNARRVLCQQSDFNTETTWDGFTIRNGRTLSSGSQPATCGGGVLLKNGNLGNCIIKDNYAYSDGGGIYVWCSSSKIRNCKVVNNYAEVYGGGIYVVIYNPVLISNCLVSNNKANSGGGGICSWYGDSYLNVVNTTIVNNAGGAGVYSSRGHSNYHNCIVWGNSSSYTGTINWTYSAVQGGCSGEGNINLSSQNTGAGNHPFFVNPTQGKGTSYYGGDWHLMESSACINKGFNAAAVDSLDLDGNPRIKYDTVDIGCYEFQGSQNIPIGDAQPCADAPTVTDYDEIVYNTVKIGNQCWMKENLRTTHYSDGTIIPLGGYSSSMPYRYCPNNNCDNVPAYGYLYNWSSVMHGMGSNNTNTNQTQGVCPEGWHVPSAVEWTQLLDYVKGQSVYLCGEDSNNIAKALANTLGWTPSQTECAVGNDVGQNNITGFGAMPAGNFYGPYDNFKGVAFFWTASDTAILPNYNTYSSDPYPIFYAINQCCSGVESRTENKAQGFSVRCLKNDSLISDYSGIIYVTPSGAGTHSGNSWANAISSIDSAQTLAEEHNAVVWVAAGTYYGDTTAVNAFTMHDGVNVYGGFTGNEPADYDLSLRDFEVNETVLDGQNARRVLYQPFEFNNEMEWNGFTIRNGNTSEHGGGVCLRKNSRLSYSRVLNNVSANSLGGGIYCSDSYISNCEIHNNNILHNYPMGGGIYSLRSTIQNCTVSENVCRYGSYGEGGGIYAISSVIDRCTIRGNKAASGGGGIYAGTNTSITGCTVKNNESWDLGGGIYSSLSSVSNCVISNNKTTADIYDQGGGGGIRCSSSEIRNCLISNNTANGNGGGGITVLNSIVINSTIVRNKASNALQGSGIYCRRTDSDQSQMMNCIVWGNENTANPEEVYGHINCSNSAIEGGYYGTEMVLLFKNDSNPLFVNPSLTAGADDTTANADWHLQDGSLFINRGNNSAVTDSVDLDGTARIKHDTVDLGCYESDYYTTPLTEYDSIIYVTLSGAGTHSGNSWANATSAIDTALIIAQAYNAAVWVAAGTYYGDTLSENAFVMKDGVNVYGGFAGDEPANYDLSLRDFETHATVLDGKNTRRVLYQSLSYSSFNTQTIWDGFTIQNGSVSGEGGGACLSGNSGLCNCIVKNNTATCGGGVRMYHSKLTNCLITENIAVGANYGGGGGIYVDSGAGICVTCPGNSLIMHCTVSNNTTAYSGGGIMGEDSHISNCLISNNTAAQKGGGIFGGRTVINTTIVRNMSENEGAGVLSNNNTKLNNCILWGNERDGVSNNISGSFTCSYSAVEGGCSGVGIFVLNSATPPFFVNPSETAGANDTTHGVDWHLLEGSPCINRGDNSVVIDSLDLDGITRIKNDTVDMGCYESDYGIVPVTLYDSIIYVTITGAGTHSGNSWENATSSIEDALGLAQTYNAVVWVAAGTYYGDTTSMSENAFTMRDGVSVYGGFAGNEPADYDHSLRDFSANLTVLDGQGSRRVVYQANSFNARTVLDGFTIQNGHASGNGGGAYLQHNALLSNCLFVHNVSQNYGGGLYYNGNSYDTIRDCSFSHNTSRSGGGVYLKYSSAINCLVFNNTSSSSGGGVYSSHGTIANSTIVRNKSGYSNGGGVYASNNTNITNSVIWGNQYNGLADNLSTTSNNVSCNYSAVEGGFTGDHNIPLSESNDLSAYSPYFVHPSAVAGATDTTANVDWHFQINSPCINGGNNSEVTLSFDIDGNVRIQHDTVDLGCYESEYPGITLPVYDSIIYVTQTGAGTKTGESWNNAMSSIQDAMSLALCHNAVVWVAAGTYYGDTTAANAFTMRDGASVYGGFAGNEPADYDLSLRDFAANPTILDGQGSRRVVYQVSSFNTRTVLDGFTIQNGYVSGSGGGAVLKHNALLSNCLFVHNVSQNYGGGLYYDGNSYDTIRDCSFSYNTSSRGGGLYLYDSKAINCLVFNNTSSSYGGGVYGYYGTIVNSTIVRNSSGGNGGGVYAYSNTNITNCVIWGNQYNGTADNLGKVSYISCSYSAVESGLTGNHIIPLSASNDNSAYSPHFIHPSAVAGATDTTANMDWHFQMNSPCINGGNNSEVTLSFDLDGNDRIQHDVVDLGCYESGNSGIGLPDYDSIIYVTQTGAGTMTGESWDNAIPSIEDAMSLATCHNAVVWVAAGTYYGDTTGVNAFRMRPGVSVYGGFAGNEPADYDLSLRDFEANATVLDGQNSRRVLYQPNDFNASTAVTWDGFTIQNGRVNGNGAGVYLMGSSSLQNCLVQYNAAYSENSNNSRYGGGVYACRNSGSVSQILHCKILHNVVENTSYGYAGGLYTYYAKVSHTEIANNSSTYRGGGIYNSSYTTFSNCLIHHNTSANGGGVYNNSSSCNYVNCDIVSNMGSGVYNYYSATFTNCIIWGNKKNYMVDNYAGGSYSYCAIEEGVSSGTGNIALASTNDGNDASQYYVRFNDPENEDFRLHPTSSCVNIGSNTSVTDSLDFYGNPRIHNEVVDIGCSEAASDSTCSSVVNLMVSNVTTNSALLSWHPTGNETQWAVAWQELNGVQTTVTVTDTFLTLSGLTFNRNYTAKVRAICDSGMMSIFSIPVYFQTDCDPTVLDTLSNFSSLMPEDSAIVYQNRVSFSWSLLPEATSYDFYLWPTTSSEPSTPTQSGLTIASVSNYQLPNYQYGKEYYWKVVAWNECISKSSEVQVIRVNKLPDLHVSQVTTSNPVAGQPLTVTWTVVNDGEGNVPPGQTWNDYIWLVRDADVRLYDNNDIRLATVQNLHTLNSGESYTNSATVTIPEDMVGNFYLFVFADQVDAYSIDFTPTGGFAPDPYTPSVTNNPYPYLSGNYHYAGVLTEVNNKDNFFYKVLNILPPPSPDLVVSSVTHPVNAFSGSQIPVTWTVLNQGEAAAVGSWYDAVYISEDTVLNTATDLRLGRFLHEGNVLIDSIYTHTEQLTIPIQYMGDYYFFVVTDYLNDIYEGLWETNNTGISNHPQDVTLTPPADLTVTSISLPDTLNANREYQCSYTVKNVGYSVTYGNLWKDVIYLSQDSVFVRDNARQLPLVTYHSGALMADSSYNDVFSFIVPSDISGWWYLYISTDDDNQIFEYLSEDNNVVKRTPALLVNIPDLTVSNVVVPDTVDPNGTMLVRWTIRNNGPGDVVNRTFSDCFTFDGEVIYNGYMSNINLNAGGTISRSAVVKIPCHDSGNSSLTITTDCLENVLEENENNNSHTVTLNLLAPDLAVTSVTSPDTMWSGTVLPEANTSQEDYSGVSYQIQNHGNLPVIGKEVTDRVYLSLSSNHFQESDLLISNTHTITLAPNETQTYSCAVPIPNGINGHYYFHVVCNVGDSICEVGNTSDNVGHSTITTLHLSPWADLVVSQVHVQDTTYIGATFPVSYTIRNNGTAPLNQAGVYQKFYYSTSPTSYDTNNLLLTKYDVLTIDQGAEVTNMAYMALPSSQLQRYYYIHVVADATDLVYEHTGENNNTAVSNSFFGKNYLLDLAAVEIDGPDVVQWGQTATYRLHVSNNSALPSLLSQWQDAMYLSNDAVLNNTDLLQQMVNHSSVLNAGDDYWADFHVTIPFGTPSSAYLLGFADYYSQNPDVNYSNNSTVKNITVNSVPTPDLAVTEMMVLDDVVSGQPARLVYTVLNAGELDISNLTWNDRIYLSLDSTYQNTDIELATQNRQNMSLAVGEYYTDTLTFTIPLPYHGGLYVLAVANATNQPYEVIRSNNVGDEQVSVTLPLPGDLIVTDVLSQDSIVSGQMLHATWNVRNVGDYPLTGNGLRTLVYVSRDTLFDVNDRLLGSITTPISLAVDAVMPQSLNARISGLAEGDYFLIVKTDVNNAFHEVNESNNTGYSIMPFRLSVRPLPFNTDVPDTLRNNEVSDFKLAVGDNIGQTVRIHLASEDSLAGAVNMIYATYNDMGDNLNYSYSTIGQHTANPELYIPSTKVGYYGVNVYGSTPVDNTQSTVIRADILPFELLSVDANHGGNTGFVTVELTGSHFRPDMKVCFRNDNDTIYPDSLIYVNYYKAFAKFDLRDRTPGLYDVSAVNFCEGEAILADAFTIENGQPSGLAYNLIFPNSPRPNRNIVMMLEYGNIGNVDLHDQVLEITSMGGCPIALTPESLSQHTTTLQVPLSIEGEPDGLLRPGSYGTINIYGYTSSGLVFSIKPVEE